MTGGLGVDPRRPASTRIALVGFSAGGHLVLLAGYAPREFSPSCDVAPVRPSTVVALAAPTELAPLYELDSWRYPDFVGFAEESKMFLPGGTPATNPEGYTATSPLTHLRRDVPPTPIIHGSRDQIVPVAQARGLEAALREPARDIEVFSARSGS